MTLTDLYHLFTRHRQISIDSRNCPEGCLFFALKGERFDGNKFAQSALENGAAYAIVDNPEYLHNERTILVENGLKTLQQLAHYHRMLLKTPIVGITGTNGKTTTKELLAAVLSTQFRVLYTKGNLNNQIGVPLTLLRLTEEHDMAVIEMGASHPGDIQELVEIVAPNYGIITNVGKAHLEGFGSLEGVLRTKGELYDYLRASQGKIFIQPGNKALMSIAGGLEQIRYVQGSVERCDPYLVFHWGQGEGEHTVETHLIGSYNLDNVLAAVTVGRYFGIPAEAIYHAIAGYEPTNNRSQLRKTAQNELIIDAYNANPSSMQAALTNFQQMQAKNKVVILGDMRELGPDSDALHLEIIEQLRKMDLHRVILCGEHFCRMGKGMETYDTTDSLADELQKNPLTDCLVLLKGSHGMALERVIEFL